MLKKIAIATLAVSSLIATAQASAVTGIYATGALGYANQSTNSTFDITDSNASLDKNSKTHFGWYTALGYNYDLDMQYSTGIEIGYGDYASAKWKNDATTPTSIEVDQTAWTLLGTLHWNMTEMFGAHIKAGAAYGKTKATIGDNADKITHRDREIRPMAALGFHMHIMPELAINAEWQHIFGHALSSTTDADLNNEKYGSLEKFQTVDAFMLGVQYTLAI